MTRYRHTAFKCTECEKTYSTSFIIKLRLQTLERKGKCLYVAEPSCLACGASLEEKYYTHNGNKKTFKDMSITY